EELPIERMAIDFAALEQRPCVGIGIGGVDGADEILGQPAPRLEVIERLEGRAGQNSAEIPKYRFYGHAGSLPALGCRTPGRISSNQPLRKHGPSNTSYGSEEKGALQK